MPPPLYSLPPEAHPAPHPPGARAKPRDVSAQGLGIGWPRWYDPALCPAAYSPIPLSDPETGPESNQSRRSQLPTLMAGGW